MLHAIGRKSDPAPDDVVGALMACHERIRSFSALALRLTTAEAAPSDVASAAEAVARYFRLALPLHVADEDLSIEPRLARATADGRVFEALDVMKAEHVMIEDMVGGLLPRWESLAREPLTIQGLRRALEADAAELSRRFDAHLEAEERLIFPAIREHLAGEGLTLREEMRARRG